jgi:hypothetical protein
MFVDNSQALLQLLQFAIFNAFLDKSEMMLVIVSSRVDKNTNKLVRPNNF